jgi:hypothetical protein
LWGQYKWHDIGEGVKSWKHCSGQDRKKFPKIIDKEKCVDIKSWIYCILWHIIAAVQHFHFAFA